MVGFIDVMDALVTKKYLTLFICSMQNVSEVHIYNASFRERIGDFDGARAAFHLCDAESDSSIVETVIKEANMETRLVHNHEHFLKL